MWANIKIPNINSVTTGEKNETIIAAIKSKSAAAVWHLLVNKADLNLKNKNRETGLNIAKKINSPEINEVIKKIEEIVERQKEKD